MPPAFVSYVTFNRLGITERSLTSILNTNEDFEMHIIDSHSSDNTWEFIQDVKDSRIKSKLRLEVNAGPIYALNFNVAKRRPDQYFITVDSDVCIKTKDWITRFMKVFDAFPEVGVMGVMRTPPYLPYYPPVIPRISNGVSFLQLQNGKVDEPLDFAHGCCMCLRPEIFPHIGFWSEECCWGDAEICPRVCNYTPFKVGFMTDINSNPLLDIDMTQSIGCHECRALKYCKLNKVTETCFSVRNKSYVNEPFVTAYKWKYLQLFKEMAEGKRTAYCASIFDPKSIEGHLYYRDWALENFNYYAARTNK